MGSLIHSKFLLGSDHSLDTVVHVLDEVDLRAAESTEVGDVEDAVVGLGVLAVGTTDLDVVLVGDSLELVLRPAELGELDVDGGAHASAEVGGARGDVTEMLVVGKLSLLLDLGGSDGETLKDLTDVGALLHRDDTELVLLVDPNEESLGVVVEDTTGLGPLALKTARLKVLVATLEKEMVSNELVTVSIAHGAERVVLALEVTSELAESRHDLSFDLKALRSSAGGAEGEVGKVAGNANSSRVDHAILVSGEIGALELGMVHVGDVLVRGRVRMVRGDDFVKQGSEGVEALVAAGVHTDARVGPLGAREDALLEGEAILVLAVLAGIPDITSEHLREKRLSAAGEEGVLRDVRRIGEMAAHHLSVGFECAVRHLTG